MPGAERAVHFLIDNGFMDNMTDPKTIKTYACGGFWACANRPEAWDIAMAFLEKYNILDPKTIKIFARGGFWACANRPEAWDIVMAFLEKYKFLDAKTIKTLACNGFWILGVCKQA
jgi:hypothetical protein